MPLALDMSRRGLFLDLDGTLADSLPVMRNVYYAFLEQYDIDGSEKGFQILNGPPLQRICEILRQTHNIPLPIEVLCERYKAMLKTARKSIQPAGGALQTLQLAKDNGWIVSIVTSSPRVETANWLNEHDLASFVRLVVGGDDVSQGKPAPQPYQLALSLSGCFANASLALEDSIQGAVSASNAGIATWLLAPSIPQVLTDQPGIQGCISDFKAIKKLL
jgi:HAD superfamily hydrolase (TIGR01509 family)